MYGPVAKEGSCTMEIRWRDSSALFTTFGRNAYGIYGSLCVCVSVFHFFHVRVCVFVTACYFCIACCYDWMKKFLCCLQWDTHTHTHTQWLKDREKRAFIFPPPLYKCHTRAIHSMKILAKNQCLRLEIHKKGDKSLSSTRTTWHSLESKCPSPEISVRIKMTQSHMIQLAANKF